MVMNLKGSHSTPAVAGRRAIVVCVDDEPAVLRAFERVLRNEPYELLTLGDPRKVLSWMDRQSADVVLSDERMPHMNGTALLGEVNQRSPQTHCALITAYPEPDLLARDTGFPIRRLIVKPWEDDDLRGAIRSLLVRAGDPGASGSLREELLQSHPEPKQGGPGHSVELRIDLEGMASDSFLEQLVPLCIWSHASKERPVLILENLGRYADSISGLLKNLARIVERIDARLYLRDESGSVATFLEASRNERLRRE